MSRTGFRPAAEAFDLMRMDRQIQRRVVGRRAVEVAAALGVAAFGLRRGGALGWAAAGAGLSVLARQVWGWFEGRPEWRKAAPITLRRWFRGDAVDVASANSFPASDSPAHDLH